MIDALAPLLVLATFAQATVPTPGDTSKSVAPLVERVKDSVVTIQSTTIIKRATRLDPVREYLRERYGLSTPPTEQRQQSLGSGFVYDAARGLVMTNNHVVAGAVSVKVLLTDSRSLDGVVVGRDQTTDIAVVRLKNPPRDLRAVVMGKSDRVRVGDYVLAIGNPLGLGQTVTMGIVSATGRGLGNKLLDYEDFIQTDAAINQGNSGGPLFNFEGHVIGVNSAILNPAMAMNVGFAIPINLARSIAEQLVTNKGVARGYLGVQTMDLTPEIAQSLGVVLPQGVVINSITEGSPAARGGLRINDIITDVGGRRIMDGTTLTQTVKARRPGEKVMVGIVRRGKRLEVEVALTEDERSSSTSAFGVIVQPTGASEIRELGRTALRVITVDASGLASGSIQEGDLIIAVTIGNGNPAPASPKNFQALEQRVAKGGWGRLVILRQGHQLVVTVG